MFTIFIEDKSGRRVFVARDMDTYNVNHLPDGYSIELRQIEVASSVPMPKITPMYPTQLEYYPDGLDAYAEAPMEK